MRDSEFSSAAADAISITQPCAEGCLYFRPLPGAAGTDFGLCANPQSPFHGYPVRVGVECARYQAELRAPRSPAAP